MAEKVVLEYYEMAVPIAAGKRIRMYNSGKVEVTGIGYSFQAQENIEGKVLKSFKVSPEVIDSYVKRLIDAKFLELDDNYEDDDESISEGGVEAGLSLNVKDYSKSVTFSNIAPESNELEQVIDDLEKLVE